MRQAKQEVNIDVAAKGQSTQDPSGDRDESVRGNFDTTCLDLARVGGVLKLATSRQDDVLA